MLEIHRLRGRDGGCRSPRGQEGQYDKSRQILDNCLADDGRPDRPEGEKDEYERVYGAGNEVGPDDPGSKGSLEDAEEEPVQALRHEEGRHRG